jgi:transcriptional regulator with XRE-family HTH domain
MNSRQSFPDTNLRSELADLLRFLRRRIDPDVSKLGSYQRLPKRLGKRVTQEELAETIGVSRQWYAWLESAAAPMRTSTQLLGRMADALMVTPDERARLFQLAVPEVARLQLRDDSVAVFDSFSRLRSLSKRLWSATSVEDVLTVAREQIADWFGDAVLIESARRGVSGPWASPPLDPKLHRDDALKCIQDIREILPTSESCDALHLYPVLRNAGDVGSPDLSTLPLRLQREILNVYDRRRLGVFSALCGRVRSRSGLVGGLIIMHQAGHSYSDTDRAVLGAFAEIASVALS